MILIRATLLAGRNLRTYTLDDPMHAQVEHWFTYHTPSPEQVACMAEIHTQAKALAKAIVSLCPPSADRTTAIRHLRDAVMTANASIVLGGK